MGPVSDTVRSVGRVGVLGDVHAEDVRLERALRVLLEQSVDAVLCVGDLVDGPGSVERCIDLLEAASAYVVIGNHERWFLASEMRTVALATHTLAKGYAEKIRAYPATLDFDTPRGRLRLAHGVGDDDMAELRPDTRGYALQAIPTLRELMLDPNVDYHVGGHTHERMVRVFPGLVALNAGTLTGDQPTVMILDFQRGTVTHIDLAAEPARPLEEMPLPSPAPLPE